MKGVILCASSKNTSRITKEYINEYYVDVEWVYLDTDSTTNPNYIGSMFDLNILIKMGLHQYDIVIIDVGFLAAGLIKEGYNVKEGQLLSACLLAKMGARVIYTQLIKQYTTELFMKNKNIDLKDLRSNVKVVNNLISELGKSVGLELLNIDTREKSVNGRPFEYDYVSFIRIN